MGFVCCDLAALQKTDGRRPRRLVGNPRQTAEDVPQGGAGVVFDADLRSRPNAQLLYVW